MDVALRKHLPAPRQALLQRLRDLQTEVLSAEQAARGTASSEPRDRKEDAGRQAADVISGAEEQRDIAELGQVRAALRRLDAGHYGDCVDCGQAIGLGRLRSLPSAERCAACQNVLERSSRL